MKPATPSERVQEALSVPSLYELWEQRLVLPQAKFFDRVFSDLRSVLNAPEGATILDMGCGPAHHAIRLARNNWHVRAMDFSEAALELARRNVENAGVSDCVALSREDLTELSLPDDSHPYIVCWGVLMHVPDVSAAIRELSRVLAMHGKLVVSELNMRSPESRVLRAIARANHRPGRLASAGAEHWQDCTSGRLLIRHAKIDWLRREFASHGVVLRGRFAGQISESRVFLQDRSRLATRAVDWLNDRAVWSETLAPFAVSNILVFEKLAGISR
jgi:ubiquinone/menaquinone biosynthesis C-methylase UbiE